MVTFRQAPETYWLLTSMLNPHRHMMIEVSPNVQWREGEALAKRRSIFSHREL